jgi:cob(I)alamin adenosyltransferase
MDPTPVYLVLFVLTAFAAAMLAARLSVRRWVRWAERTADFGTTDILNAQFVDSDDAVVRLRAEFEAWSTLVKDGTARFCQEDDAHRVQFFATPPSPDVTGFNDEHRYIRDATAERVRRLRDLIARLEQGATSLRRSWVPRVSD